MSPSHLEEKALALLIGETEGTNWTEQKIRDAFILADSAIIHDSYTIHMAVRALVSLLRQTESPEMTRLAVKLAVDAAWSGVECASIVEREGETEWFNVGEDAESLEDEMRLLVGLKLAEIHPEHPEWIREVAEL